MTNGINEFLTTINDKSIALAQRAEHNRKIMYEARKDTKAACDELDEMKTAVGEFIEQATMAFDKLVHLNNTIAGSMFFGEVDEEPLENLVGICPICGKRVRATENYSVWSDEEIVNADLETPYMDEYEENTTEYYICEECTKRLDD